MLFSGTEVDDEEYFATLERNTSLMVLQGDQKWNVAGSLKTASRYIVVDNVDSVADSSCGSPRRHRTPIEPLVSTLHGDPSHISLLGGHDLELLSDMNPDSLADIVPDRWVKLRILQTCESFNVFLHNSREDLDRSVIDKMGNDCFSSYRVDTL